MCTTIVYNIKAILLLYTVMFGDLEWLIWFIIVGIFITIIYMITMHFVLKKERERNRELEISFLEEIVLEDERDKF